MVGTPLDFRLGYGSFGGRDGTAAAKVVHLADSAGQVATHLDLAASAAGDLTRGARRHRGGLGAARPPPVLRRLGSPSSRRPPPPRSPATPRCWPPTPTRSTRPASTASCSPAWPRTPCVIGDGGDFVSFAGRFVEPARPGGWLDPGPYGCLGTGLGYAIAARLARPSAQVVLLLGDGAAGFSLMDVDTLVRHRLPVVMVVGNNGMWGLEKHPMQFLYGYDVAAELRPGDARTTRWSARSAAPARPCPARRTSGRRSTGRSPPACPTSSTS